MYKKLISLLTMLFVLIALIAVAPVEPTQNAVDVVCGMKVAQGVSVRSIQGPSLNGPCKPVEGKKEPIAPQVPAVSRNESFSIMTGNPIAVAGFDYNQYSGGSNRGILASVTTNRSFSIGSTGYQQMFVVLQPEDDQCGILQTSWLRDPSLGTTTKYAAIYNTCTGFFEYSQVMTSAWVTDYERNILWAGAYWPGYSEALIQTSAGCFRGTLYNYTVGTWQWKGNAMCGSTANAKGSVFFEMAADSSGLYPTYTTDFNVMNGYTINTSGQWDVIPLNLMTTTITNPPFSIGNSNPYRLFYGTSGIPAAFFVTAQLH